MNQMIFCPIPVVHINSCLRLNLFSLFSSSLTAPYLPHLSLSSEYPHFTSLTSPSPCFRLPHSLTLPLPSLPLPLPLSLSPPSPLLLLPSLNFHSSYLPLSPSPHLPLAPSLLPLLPPFSSPLHSSILIDYVNLVFVVVVEPVCDAVYWYAVCHCA